jgi:DNA-directed RNA polymerase subunit E'/Rpb7
MIETKKLTVLLNISPKYFHQNLIYKYINEQLEKMIINNCFQDLGKVLKIKKIISVQNGKIHIDTGFSKTPVTFEVELYIPKVDEIVKGTVEKCDTNGGVYVNYKNIVSIFCLKTNINQMLLNDTDNKKGKLNKKQLENFKNIENEELEIGKEVNVKITKVNINEQNMIIIGKII